MVPTRRSARTDPHAGTAPPSIEPRPGATDPPPWEDPLKTTFPDELPASDDALDSLWDLGSGSGEPPAGTGRAQPQFQFQCQPQSLGGYRLIEPLGRGGQGEVWKAVRFDPEPRIVALKVLRLDRGNRAARRERFRREAELGMRLVGPSLLAIEEFGEVDGVMYIAMSLIEGGSLADAIAHRRRPADGHCPRGGEWWDTLPGAEFTVALVRVVSRVARALEMAHARGVVHRDVKPSNILLDRTSAGDAFLIDFGLGRDLDDATSPRGDGSGTPLFMAPEKLLGGVVDEVRCDIYSLGMTLFEAATLAPPFAIPEGLHRSCLGTYLAGLAPPRPRAIRPDLPPRIEAIILKAVDRDPARRHGRAAELADDLDDFLKGAGAARTRRTSFGRSLIDLLRTLAPARD